MLQKAKYRLPFILFCAVITLSTLWLVLSPTTTEAEKITEETITSQEISLEEYTRYILIDLEKNEVTLFDKKKLLTLPIVTQGKPGSYYETIGGIFLSDYKIPLHFSTLGGVYMPYSVHLFGNYFIHGIPYYPNGTRVSSSYSGGCVRLNDNDAKIIYDFVTEDTPIIITREGLHAFSKTSSLSPSKKVSSLIMTRLMTAIISLEFLNQDTLIQKNNALSSRLTLLPSLLLGSVANPKIFYKDSMSDDYFLRAMNVRAKTLGLTNTTFSDINQPALTTEEDYGRFMSHILTYKSYLAVTTGR